MLGYLLKEVIVISRRSMNKLERFTRTLSDYLSVTNIVFVWWRIIEYERRQAFNYILMFLHPNVHVLHIKKIHQHYKDVY